MYIYIILIIIYIVGYWGMIYMDSNPLSRLLGGCTRLPKDPPALLEEMILMSWSLA